MLRKLIRKERKTVVKYDLSKVRRYFSNGLSYVLGFEKVYGKPAHIHIETTNICNFRCIYCPQSVPDEHFKLIGRGKMSFETFKLIIDKLTAKYQIERIVLTRDGEPLVHPELEDFIGYVTSKGIKTTIGSNGSLISEKRAHKLIKNGLTTLKGDFCYDKIEYERLRAGAKYEKSLAGYKNILQAAREQNADFGLVMVDLNTHNLKDQEDINKSITQLRSLFNGYERWLSLGPAVMHNAFGESKVTLSTSLIKFKGQKRRYNLCHHPWLEMVIDYKGNVVACCRDLRSEYQLGNILETDDIDKDIWNGERMRNLRRNLLNRTPENINICNKCDLPYGVSYAGNTIHGKILRFLRS